MEILYRATLGILLYIKQLYVPPPLNPTILHFCEWNAN